MPVLVQNEESNATVFDASSAGGRQVITWQAKGDSLGEDVQRVPDALLDDVDFLRSLDQGILTLVNPTEEQAAKVNTSNGDLRARRMLAEQRSTEALDRRQDRDITSQPCIGPGPEGRDMKCGASVLMRAAQRNEVPPLCKRHEHLVNEFSRVDSGSRGEGATPDRDGAVTQEWKRVQIDAPRRSS